MRIGVRATSIYAQSGVGVLLHPIEPVAEWLRWNIKGSMPDSNGVQPRRQPFRVRK